MTSADGKELDEISAEIKELAGRARIGKLQLHEFQGGSFTYVHDLMCTIFINIYVIDLFLIGYPTLECLTSQNLVLL